MLKFTDLKVPGIMRPQGIPYYNPVKNKGFQVRFGGTRGMGVAFSLPFPQVHFSKKN